MKLILIMFSLTKYTQTIISTCRQHKILLMSNFTVFFFFFISRLQLLCVFDTPSRSQFSQPTFKSSIALVSIWVVVNMGIRQSAGNTGINSRVRVRLESKCSLKPNMAYSCASLYLLLLLNLWLISTCYFLPITALP